jgi:DNA repair protein RadC
LSHNHPSGNLKPSQQDIDLTRKVKLAGNFLDIPVYDHLIVTDNGFYSFADEGIL